MSSPVKKLTVGILAHVDAGKTTLTEALLFQNHTIRTMGRVDKGSAFLDTDSQEKKRGITIFSKQAVLPMKNSLVTIIDTPGHMDFAAETERAVSVLDLAILLISARDGLTEQGKEFFSLLRDYRIPTAVFVNKMDQVTISRETYYQELKKEFHEVDNSLNFVCRNASEEEQQEDVAACEEQLTEKYLQDGSVTEEDLFQAVRNLSLCPVYFGSALHLEGTDCLLQDLPEFFIRKPYHREFGARVFKIARDEADERLTFLKVTGGSLSVRDTVGKDKITGIRIYSGGRYEPVSTLTVGDVAAVTGLTDTYAGEGLGIESDQQEIRIQPVLRYEVDLPEKVSPRTFLPQMKKLEEEDPTLQVQWNEDEEKITISVMGELELEILQSLAERRFGVSISYSEGTVIYRETILSPSYGFGHFEPLRHYADVQVLLEPLPEGAGIEVATDVPAGELKINWQKAVLDTLTEDLPAGVLTGSELTDMKITLTAGKASVKHSSTGDFRQAVRRAVRAALLATESRLMEPWFSFRLVVPNEYSGRAMNDITLRHGKCEIQSRTENETVLTGTAPAVLLRNYQAAVSTYTKGSGQVSLKFSGYHACHNPEEVIRQFHYQPDLDRRNPSDSVFVRQGSSLSVPWEEAEQLMQTDSRRGDYFETNEGKGGRNSFLPTPGHHRDLALGTDEIDKILENASHANQNVKKKRQPSGNKRPLSQVHRSPGAVIRKKRPVVRDKYLLVDGYNIIHAWSSLKELTEENMDGARFRLLDILTNFQPVFGGEIIVVFDAYRVHGHYTTRMDYQNIHVVYTKEAETADQYLAKFSLQHKGNPDITIATSDGMIQLIIRGAGAHVLSARELEEWVNRSNDTLMRQFQSGNYDPFDI